MTSTTCGSSVSSPHTRTQVQLGDPEDVFGESLSRGITVTREAGKNASAEFIRSTLCSGGFPAISEDDT